MNVIEEYAGCVYLESEIYYFIVYHHIKEQPYYAMLWT